MVRGSPAVAVIGLPGLTTVALAVPEPSVTRAAKPMRTTSVAKTSATATTFRWVRRLAASSEKLFMTRSPKTSQSLVAASRRKVQLLAPAGDHPRTGCLPAGLLFPIPPISHHHSPALPERDLRLRPSQTCRPIGG